MSDPLTSERINVDQVREDLTDEIAIALGLSPKSLARRLLAPLVRLPTQRFAELLSELDLRARRESAREAARWLMSRMVAGVRAYGAERVPATGPLLLACNHPGAVDGLAALSEMHRSDIKLVISGIPIFHHFPAGKQLMIYVPRQGAGRMAPVREAIRHLETGGSVLIMPGGHVEPDPAFLPGAREALSEWSPSVETLLRRVPETQVQVTIISGVLSPSWLRHPLVRLRKGQREKQLLAEFLMIIQQTVLRRREPLTPEVTFGQPVTAAELRGGDGSRDLMPALIEHAGAVLDEHMARIGAAAKHGLDGCPVGAAGI